MDQIIDVSAVAAVPVITALVAAVGASLPSLPRRWYPLLAVALAIAWSVAVARATGTLAPAVVLDGIVVGLAASGFYSGGVKPVAQRITAS